MFMNTVGYTVDKFLTIPLASDVTLCQIGKHLHSYHQVSDKGEQFMEELTNSYEPSNSRYRCKHAPIYTYEKKII